MPGVGCYRNYDHYIATKGQPLSDSSQILNTGNERMYPEGSSPEKCLLLNPEPTPGYKEFIDAEHLMPLATSDFKQPVCVELNCLRREGLAPKALPETAPSLDSSDTFASCLTHPFPSEGDITRESDSNLYVNPLDQKVNQQYKGVKKSTSGDSALLCSNKNSSQGSRQSLTQQANQSLTGSRSSLCQPLQPSKMGSTQKSSTKSYQGSKSSLGLTLEDSRGSLNESLPKHRKTRFQQEWADDEKKPPRGIATRIINHHIFGAKNGNKRSAWSSEQDTIRARSILKNKEARGTDSEFLIQDMASLGANGDSGNESSPVRKTSFKQNHCKSEQDKAEQLVVSDARKTD